MLHKNSLGLDKLTSAVEQILYAGGVILMGNLLLLEDVGFIVKGYSTQQPSPIDIDDRTRNKAVGHEFDCDGGNIGRTPHPL